LADSAVFVSKTYNTKSNFFVPRNPNGCGETPFLKLKKNIFFQFRLMTKRILKI